MLLAILLSVALALASGLISLATRKRPGLSGAVGAGGAALAGAIGFVAAAIALARGASETARVAWNTGVGASLAVGVDPLSLFFLLPIFGLTGLAAVYGYGYHRHSEGRSRERAGGAWLCYNLLTASMVLAVIARNGVLFLFAWEAMTLSSYFLVVFDHERADSRRAGIVYLVAAQIGTAALLVLFLVLADPGAEPIGSVAFLDFDRLGAGSRGAAAACFLLAAIGFGTKAGFVPLHVWLPEAHPAAPSHVSAVMSGVMIKTGIYGLVRLLSILGRPEPWWGWVVLGLGAVSGVLGVLLALAQHDLKRLLAYHSVENVGIIAIGIGVGMLGMAFGQPAVALLGWAGGLLHVLNHAVFKGLLFMGAGSVLHASGTREIDRLGGLAKRMPVTAAAFLVGSVAISGLPPLNGFLSEFLIFSGALASAVSGPLRPVLVSAIVFVALGLIGGLAAACFTKAYGIVFLGEPRSSEASEAHESAPSLLAPMVVLAASCLAIGLLGSVIVPAMAPLVSWASGVAGSDAAAILTRASMPLRGITLGALVLVGVACALAFARLLLLRRRSVRETGTWDCGYAAPTSRMQYTASSFAQPVLDMFHLLLRPHRRDPEMGELFPKAEHFHSETHDLFAHRVYRPAARLASRLASPLRRLQHGNLHLYVLYIVIALLALAIWKMW